MPKRRTTPILIAGFPIDATLSQDHALNNEVTDHPVEQGADTSDHILLRPIFITLDCIVSNAPIAIIEGQREEDELPSDKAYGHLVDIRNKREPVSIESELGIWTNMALLDLTLPFTADTGDALQFRVTFKQIELVTNERTTIEVAVPRAKKKVNRGNKPSKTAGADGTPNPEKKSTQNRSVLKQLIGAF